MATPSVGGDKQGAVKFALLLLLLCGYGIYLSHKYGAETGITAAALTWSFFVLCTPIADAGFLLDFPLRVLFGIRMVYSEIAVWVIAIVLNLTALHFMPDDYQAALPTQVLKEILTHPYPYWGIILLSAAGTFLSICFGDEVMDSVHDKKSMMARHHIKHEVIMIAFFLLTLWVYYQLISSLKLSTSVFAG